MVLCLVAVGESPSLLVLSIAPIPTQRVYPHITYLQCPKTVESCSHLYSKHLAGCARHLLLTRPAQLVWHSIIPNAVPQDSGELHHPRQERLLRRHHLPPVSCASLFAWSHLSCRDRNRKWRLRRRHAVCSSQPAHTLFAAALMSPQVLLPVPRVFPTQQLLGCACSLG